MSGAFSRTRRIAAAALLLASTPAAGEELSYFASYVPRAAATKIERDEAPNIDGDLSDPAWAKATVIEEFYQVEPAEGAPPSQKTHAYVLYDEKTLYVGFRLFDDEPEKIVRNQLVRDAELRDEDAIRIFLIRSARSGTPISFRPTLMAQKSTR